MAARTRKMNKVELAEVATLEPRGRRVVKVTGVGSGTCEGRKLKNKQRIAFVERDGIKKGTEDKRINELYVRGGSTACNALVGGKRDGEIVKEESQEKILEKSEKRDKKKSEGWQLGRESGKRNRKRIVEESLEND